MAWKLGNESGDDALTIRNIASHVGISPALLYTYFEGKGALMREMQSMATPQLEAYLGTAVAAASSPNEALFRLCVAYVEFAREHRWLYSMTARVHESGVANRSTDSFVAHAIELLNGSDRADDEPTTRALQLRIALAGLAEAQAPGAIEMRPRLLSSDQRSFVESYVRMLLRGI
jgi:AcrR family transcriptional regulator